MATLSGIALLNKRYTTDEWASGVKLNGATKIPKLFPGEFGFNISTGEIRANLSNTYRTNETTYNEYLGNPTDEQWGQTFADATPISFPGFKDTITATEGNITKKYVQSIAFERNEDDSYLQVTEAALPQITLTRDTNDPGGSADTPGQFIVSLRVDPNNDHNLIYTTGDHPVNSITIQLGNETSAADLTAETVKVLSSLSRTDQDSPDHVFTYDTVEVPTKAYMDGVTADSKIEVNQTAGPGFTDGVFVSSISKNETTDHTIDITTQYVPTYDVVEGDHLTGDSCSFLGAVSIDTAPTGDGIKAAKHNEYKINATRKTLAIDATGSGKDQLSISEEANSNIIKIKFDDSKYATLADCSKSMVFRGFLSQSGDTSQGYYTILPDADMRYVGDTYKVMGAGTYGGISGAEIGDLIVCRQLPESETCEWVLIPAGDDVDEVVNVIQPGTGILVADDDTDTTKGTKTAPIVSHQPYYNSNYSDPSDQVIYDLHGGFSEVSEGNKKYGYAGEAVTALKFDTDNLGHVIRGALSTELSLASIDGAKNIVNDFESTTVLTSGNVITVENNGAGRDGKKGPQHNYTVSHNTVTVEQVKAEDSAKITLGYGGTFNVVTSVKEDVYGHLNQVTTQQVQLPASDNTYREIRIQEKENPQDGLQPGAQPEVFLTHGSTTPLTLISGTNIALVGNSGDGTITINAPGIATSGVPGFVRLGTDEVLTLEDPTPGNTDHFTDGGVYPVGMNSDKQLVVAVPWINTDVYGHKDNLAQVQKFGAITTDKGGHVEQIIEINILDANY